MSAEQVNNTEENPEANEDIRTPFSWKKVLLAPLKALWSVIVFLAKIIWWVTRFILKTAWWLTKLALFFVFIGLGIIVGFFGNIQSIGDSCGGSRINQDEYEWVNGERVLVKKRLSSRIFRVAGRLWKSLWGGSGEEE